MMMRSGGARILVAEERPSRSAVLRDHFGDAGLTVSMFRGGAAVLSTLDDGDVAVVVADVDMPVMGGHELCRAIRERHPGVPVVLVGEASDALGPLRAMACGAAALLPKPYEPADLVACVRDALGAAAGAAAPSALAHEAVAGLDTEGLVDLLVSAVDAEAGASERVRSLSRELALERERAARADADAARERSRLDAVLAAVPTAMAVVDTDGRVVSANASLADMIGQPLSRLQEAAVWETIVVRGADGAPMPVIEEGLKRTLADGRSTMGGTSFSLFLDGPAGPVPVVARSEPVRHADGEIIGAVGSFHDARGFVTLEPATGLPGRAVLLDRLRTATAASSACGTTTALVVLVVDEHDAVGVDDRSCGSGLVATVATRLRRTLEADDLRRRAPGASAVWLGNGAMAVLVPEVDSCDTAGAVAQLLTEALPFEPTSGAAPVTVTAAVATCEVSGDHAADVAMAVRSARTASGSGGGRVVTSDPDRHFQVVDQLRREAELRRAIPAGELVVHYQPLVNVRDERPLALEALVRWQHPDRGLLGEEDVLVLATSSGLISDLGWRVLEDACRQAAAWRATLAEAQDLSLRVNVAAEQLADPAAAVRIAEILDATGLEPAALTVGITEGCLVDDPVGARQRLHAIRGLGPRVAIDFASGYSSMLQSRRMPVNVLTVDRSHVSGMLGEVADAATVAGAVQLGRALGLEVVAEGVETLDQLAHLRILGCDVAQGEYWSEPMSAADAEVWWIRQANLPRLDPVAGATMLDADEPRNEAVSYIVHELRSPLSVVSGYTGLLSETEPVQERRHWLDAIARSAAEIASRLDDLADTQDMFRGGLDLRPEPQDVGELVRTIVHDLRPQLQPHDVNLTVQADVHATIDRGRLGQAVGNLLTNAAKFSPDDAPVDVRVSADDDVVAISVRDRGCGVPEHRRAELFRRFSRLGSRAKGMGIGLYLARSIVEAHGGVLRYDPAPGEGSVFSIQLLRVPVVHDQAGAPVEPAATGREHAPITVLCVEDDRANVTLIERMLEGHVADVLTAPDSATGLELARLRRPDVVLLDLQLGEESGLDVLHGLRADVRTAAIPVVILSGAVNADSVSRLRAFGATAVVAKPVGVDELRRTVDEAVAGCSAQESTARGGGHDEVVERRPAPAIDAPGIDEPLDLRFVEALLDLDDASDDEGGMVALVRAMLADARTNLEGLEAAVRTGDTDAAARIAHSLRGGLANLGAHVVAGHCHDLETMARTAADTGLDSAYRLVAASLDEAEAALQERLSIRRS